MINLDHDFYHPIILYCEERKPKKVALVASNYHIDLINALKPFNVECYERNPFIAEYKYIHKDVIFDDCDFSGYDLIVNLSPEKMYPMAKLYPGYYILVFPKYPSPRDCTPITNHCLEIDDIIDVYNKVVMIGKSQS